MYNYNNFLLVSSIFFLISLLSSCGSKHQSDGDDSGVKSLNNTIEEKCNLVSSLAGQEQINGTDRGTLQDRLNRIVCLNARGTVIIESVTPATGQRYKSLGYVIASLTEPQDEAPVSLLVQAESDNTNSESDTINETTNTNSNSPLNANSNSNSNENVTSPGTGKPQPSETEIEALSSPQKPNASTGDEYVYILSSLYLAGPIATNPHLAEITAKPVSISSDHDFYHNLDTPLAVTPQIDLRILTQSEPVYTAESGTKSLTLVGYGRMSINRLDSDIIDLVAIHDYETEQAAIKKNEEPDSDDESSWQSQLVSTESLPSESVEVTQIPAKDLVVAFGIYRIPKKALRGFGDADNDRALTVVSLGKEDLSGENAKNGHYMTLENAHQLFASDQKKAEAWIYQPKDIQFPAGVLNHIGVEIGDGLFNFFDDFPPFTYNTNDGRMEAISFFAEDQPQQFNNQFQMKSFRFIQLIKGDPAARSKNIIKAQEKSFPISTYRTTLSIHQTIPPTGKIVQQHCGAAITQEGSEKPVYQAYQAISLQSDDPSRSVTIKINTDIFPSNLLTINNFEGTAYQAPSSQFDLVELYVNSTNPENRINRSLKPFQTEDGSLFITIQRASLTHFDDTPFTINNKTLSEFELPPAIIVKIRGYAVHTKDNPLNFPDEDNNGMPDELTIAGTVTFCAILNPEQEDHADEVAIQETKAQVVQYNQKQVAQGHPPMSTAQIDEAINQSLKVANIGKPSSLPTVPATTPPPVPFGTSGTVSSANGTAYQAQPFQGTVTGQTSTLQSSCAGNSCTTVINTKQNVAKIDHRARETDDSGCSIQKNKKASASGFSWGLFLSTFGWLLCVPAVLLASKTRQKSR